jgi:hypothetical protein
MKRKSGFLGVGRKQSLLLRPLFPIMLAVATVAALGAATATEQRAAGPATDIKGVEQELERQKKLLDEQRKTLEATTKLLQDQQNVLLEQRQQLDSLRSLFYGDSSQGHMPSGTDTKTGSKFSPRQPASYSVGRTAGDVENKGVSKTQGGGPTTARPPEGQRPEIENPALYDEGGVLTPRGMIVVEPSFEYLFNSDNRILVEGITVVPGITIGTLDVRRVNQDFQTYAMALRGGITNRLEVDVKVPYVKANSSTTARAVGATTDTTTVSSGSGIGDIEAGAHYQINDGKDGWPFFITNLRYKARNGRDPFSVPLSPTSGLELEQPVGTGFTSWEPSLTAILPSDPVVFFANFRYVVNVGRRVNLQPTPGTGNVPIRTLLDPGDGIGGSVGMGFGINERASFSLGYEHTHIKTSLQDGNSIQGSSFDLGSFTLGFSYRISPAVSVNLGFSLGATDNAPDTRALIRIPVRLQVL